MVSRGGFYVGNGINWKGQVFSKMRNHTATNRMTVCTYCPLVNVRVDSNEQDEGVLLWNAKHILTMLTFFFIRLGCWEHIEKAL